MKKLLIIILLFPLTIKANRGVDSLLNFIKWARHDSSKVVAYEQLAVSFRKDKPDSAFLFNEQAIKIAKSIDNKNWLAEAYREYALTAQAAGKYSKAVEYYKKTLATYQKVKNVNGQADSYNDIGVAYYYSGDYENARINFEKSGELKIEVGDSIGAGQSFNNTGIMHDIAGNPTEAIKLYLKALNIYENLRDTLMTIGTLSNVGLIYIGQKNYKEALKTYARQKKLAKAIGAKKHYGIALTSEGTAYDYLEQYDTARTRFKAALEIFLELGDKPLIAQCYNNLSVNYELTNEDDKALEYALKSIKIKEEIGSYGKLAVSQIAAAKIYNKKGQYQKALNLFNNALTNAENTGYLDYEIKAHKGLALTYENLKNYKKAYEHQSIYVDLADSVTNKENTELINELEKKYQSERKEQEIELLNKTNDLQAAELAKRKEESKRKSIQLYGSLGVGLILFILVLFIYRSNQQRKKNNIILQQKNKEITQQKEIVEAQHKEITDSITYAKRIQSAILPPNKLVKEYLQNSFILYKPKDIVAGDFYWLETVNDKNGETLTLNTQHSTTILFAACDCTGHGVPGAMVSVVCVNGLNRSVREHGLTEPGKILDKTREIVVSEFEKSEEEVKDGMDIALCKLEIPKDNSQKIKLEYAGANNPLWIVRKGSEEIEEIKADKQPIGKYQNPQPYNTHKIELSKDDTIYIFSDGYADQFGGEKGKKLKTANFKKLLLSIQHESMVKQRELIDQAFEAWKGDLDQLDDVCVIGVRI